MRDLSDVPDPTAAPDPLKGDPARQAVASTTGTLYQIWSTIDAWLCLASADEVIYLEGAEDFDRVGMDEATATQLKHEAMGLSLNNQRSHEVLENFWGLMQRESTRRVECHYLTTAATVRERDAAFDGMCGVEAWRAAQTNVAMAARLQAYLAPKLASDSPLRGFLHSATPELVQERLVRRVHWFFDQPGLDAIQRSVKDRLVVRLSQQNLPLTAVEGVQDRLYRYASDVITRPETADRSLNLADLCREFDAATARSLALSPAQHSQLVGLLQAGTPHSGLALLHRLRLPLPAAPSPLLNRPALIDAVSLRVARRQAVLLTGTVHKGKTTLAQLVAHALCPDAWWFPMAQRTGVETDNLLRELAVSVEDAHAPPLIIVDNIDLSPAAHAAYGQALAVLASRATRSGRGLLLTARGESAEAAQLSDFAGFEAVEVPELAEDEVAALCIEFACPVPLATPWAKLIHMGTRGHPKLVQVRIAELQSRAWPAPAASDLLSDSEAVASARQAARRMLRDSESAEVAAFVYTAAEATIPLKRRILVRLADAVAEGVNAGDVVDSLRGRWIEQVEAERFRVTPLLSGSAREVWPDGRRRLVHVNLYDAIMGDGNVDDLEAASLLFHAFMSQDDGRLAQCARVLETLRDSNVSAAVFQQLVWLPYVAVSQGERFLPANRIVSVMLRQLQFSVADQLGSEHLRAIIERWSEEMDLVAEPEPRAAFEAMRCFKLLISTNPRIPLRTKLRAVTTLGGLTGEAARECQKDAKRFIARSAIDGLPPNATPAQFFLVLHAGNVRSTDHLAEVVAWLEDDANETDRQVFEAIVKWPLVASLGSYVHGAWSALDATTTDWTPIVETLTRAITASQRFGLAHFGSEAARALSIVQSEHLRDQDAALRTLDEATALFGANGVLREQRANVFFQVRDDAGALAAFDALIADSDASKDLDAFAFRRAGISASRLARWNDAQRYFLAGAAVPPVLSVETTRFGLAIDAAHVAALSGEPQRAARWLSDRLTQLPAAAWEDGHVAWEAVFRVLDGVFKLIEAAANQGDLRQHVLSYGKASEPGLNLGPPQPNQALRTQLATARAGALSAQLGDVAPTFRSVLAPAADSLFPIARWFAARASLALDYHFGAVEEIAPDLARFERAWNALALVADKPPAEQFDAGDHRPTNNALRPENYIVVFAAAATCCDDPHRALPIWRRQVHEYWADSALDLSLDEMALGLGRSRSEAMGLTHLGHGGSMGERIGAAVSLLRAANLAPLEVLRLQRSIASLTVSREEGAVLRDTFERPMARWFAQEWSRVADNPFLLSTPKLSVPALRHIIAEVQRGTATVTTLLAAASRALREANCS